MDLVAHGVRHAHAAGLGQCLEPGRDVDPVAKNDSAIDDDVAEVDANAKADAALLWCVPIAVEHAALDFGGTAHRIHDVAEFDQHAVAGGLDDTAAIFGDLRVDEVTAVRLQPAERALFIFSLQPRIARDIGGEDGYQTAGCGRALLFSPPPRGR